MKTATVLAVALITATSIPLLAQEAGASAQQNSSAAAAGTNASESTRAGASVAASPGAVDANGSATDSAKTTYASPAHGFGDQAASHAWEMSSVTGELQGKLDSKTARPGDRVVLKTTDKVQTSDGTVIPRGTRLIGHVTEVQAYDKEHGAARIGIAFDRAELKDGQTIPVHTLIRGVNPSASAMAMSQDDAMADDGMMDAPMGGGGRMGGGPAMGAGRGGAGVLGGAGGVVNQVGGTVNRTGGMAGGAVNGTAETVGSVNDRADADLGAAADSTVQTAGRGALDADAGAHGIAAARAIPHATGIPGVMLAGNSSASGVLSATRRNIQFESGTQMQLGIVADK